MEVFLRDAINILKQAGCESARIDAELILGHVLSKSRITLYSEKKLDITPEQKLIFDDMIRRRSRFEPIAYILGHCEFYGYQFQVSNSVLIPRAETELLVEHALEKMAYIAKTKNISPLVLDIGTGTACIAIALAKNGKGKVIAWEKSLSALKIAEKNSKILDAGVELRQVDIFDEDAWSGQGLFDIIVSNPPYIALYEKDKLCASVASYEPEEALFGGEDGLKFFRCLSENAISVLKQDGFMILEIGYRQSQQVIQLLKNRCWRDIMLFQDLNGLDRVIVVRRP